MENIFYPRFLQSLYSLSKSCRQVREEIVEKFRVATQPLLVSLARRRSRCDVTKQFFDWCGATSIPVTAQPKDPPMLKTEANFPFIFVNFSAYHQQGTTEVLSPFIYTYTIYIYSKVSCGSLCTKSQLQIDSTLRRQRQQLQ